MASLMPDTIRARVCQMMQQLRQQHGEQSYAEIRHAILTHYPELYPAVSRDAWDRELRPAVMRAVQGILESMS
jgi:hypothetical protein